MASAATVTVISPADLPAASPVVAFESLPAVNTSGTPSYTEEALTLSYSRGLYGSKLSNSETKVALLGYYQASGDNSLGTGLFSFSTPVSQVSMMEYEQPINAVTLYADAAGTQSLGQFSTTHTTTPRPYGFAFQSDTAFRSFSVTINPVQSFRIDDLRYNNATPEPTPILVGGAAAIGTLLLQRRRTA